jgi:2-(1,2-epoxy-1,2-dihydrophenyl)acetyl-CoA isomerase
MGDAPASGLTVEKDGGILRLRLDRPGSGNSISRGVIRDFLEAFDDATAGSDVRVIALSATGKDFCTGIDLKEANQKTGERPRIGNHQRRILSGPHRLIRAFAELQLPVVVGVRGWVTGIGNSLALTSDYVVASRTAKFWTPFTGRGFTPDSASTWLIPRLVGVPRAKEMLLLARPIEAEKAERWGMIHEVVDDDALEARHEEVVQEFAHAATVSVGLAKTLLHRNLELDLDQALAAESMALEVSLRSNDFKEGIAAFMERRKPDYTGG